MTAFVLIGALLSAGRARAQSTAAVVSSTVSWYDAGMALRAQGRMAQARAAFQNLRDQNPDSVGALEGLTLTDLSLGENQKALDCARRWVELRSSSTYALGFEARALSRLNQEDTEIGVNRHIVALDPCDIVVQHRLDDEMTRLRDGIFPYANISQSIGPEELNTTAPQRIVYASKSIGTDFQKYLSPSLGIIGGAGLNEQIQANETGGFTYFDVLEQTYSLGLEGRPTPDLYWRAKYGQSEISNVKGNGVGNVPFSRVDLLGQWHAAGWDWGANADRRPYYLRGAGGVDYFALLRREDAGLSASGPLLGMDWSAKAGVSQYSDATTWKTASVQGTKEIGSGVFTPWYSHGVMEYYGATPTNNVGYVVTDGAGLRWRRLVADNYKLSASYGQYSYYDGNREGDISAEADKWLPWLKDDCGARPFYVAYRYDSESFPIASPLYLSTPYHSHTLGVYWRKGWGGSWTTLGYEHAFWVDGVRGDYESNAGILKVEAYRRGDLSLNANARAGNSTVRDQSYSAGFSARYSFR